MKIIDSHVHVYPEFLQKEFDRLAQSEPWFALLASSKVQKWGTAEELVAAMDETGVESSLVTTFAFRDQGLCREMNDYVLDAARRFPGRILPLAVVSPARPGAREAADFCRKFPMTKVIFAHFGGGLWAFEAMPEMRLLLQNARYDTAAWPWLYGPEILDAIFAAGAGDKIFFGSDWPILGLPRYEKLAAQTKLSDAEKEKLFGGNVREFLGI